MDRFCGGEGGGGGRRGISIHAYNMVGRDLIRTLPSGMESYSRQLRYLFVLEYDSIPDGRVLYRREPVPCE